MADECDIADRAQEQFLSAAIQTSINLARVETHNATGLCWNCYEPTGFESRYCVGGECADDFDKRQRMG